MELKASDLAALGKGLASNQSLTHLDVSGNQVSKQHFLTLVKCINVLYNYTERLLGIASVEQSSTENQI